MFIECLWCDDYFYSIEDEIITDMVSAPREHPWDIHDVQCEQDLSKNVESEYVSVSECDYSYFKETHLNIGQIGSTITTIKSWTVLV